MVTPKMWAVSEDGGSFCSEPEPVSECAPHLDPKRRLREDTLGISNDDGTPRFEVSRTGRTEQGAVDSYIKIAPIESVGDRDAPARWTMAAARRATPTAWPCSRRRRARRDADCTTLPPPSIPGETASCAIYVNKSASAATFSTLDMEWTAACASAGEWCVEASRPVCKSGACADPCAGLALPMCPVACGVDYAAHVAKTPCQAAFSCQQADGLRVYLARPAISAASRPRPSMRVVRIGCLPAPATWQRPPHARIPAADAGTIDPDNFGADGGAGADGGSGGEADGGNGGAADGSNGEADGKTDAATAAPSDTGAG